MLTLTPTPTSTPRGPDDHFIVDQRPRGYAGVLDQLVKVRAFALCGLIVRSCRLGIGRRCSTPLSQATPPDTTTSYYCGCPQLPLQLLVSDWCLLAGGALLPFCALCRAVEQRS